MGKLPIDRSVLDSALERMEPQVVLPEEVMGRARRPVERMIGLS